jgi:hypothetical protein
MFVNMDFTVKDDFYVLHWDCNSIIFKYILRIFNNL